MGQKLEVARVGGASYPSRWGRRSSSCRRLTTFAFTHTSRAMLYSTHWHNTRLFVHAMANPFTVCRRPSA